MLFHESSNVIAKRSSLLIFLITLVQLLRFHVCFSEIGFLTLFVEIPYHICFVILVIFCLYNCIYEHIIAHFPSENWKTRFYIYLNSATRKMYDTMPIQQNTRVKRTHSFPQIHSRLWIKRKNKFVNYGLLTHPHAYIACAAHMPEISLTIGQSSARSVNNLKISGSLPNIRRAFLKYNE